MTSKKGKRGARSRNEAPQSLGRHETLRFMHGKVESRLFLMYYLNTYIIAKEYGGHAENSS